LIKYRLQSVADESTNDVAWSSRLMR
jgi:hypothetical protein